LGQANNLKVEWASILATEIGQGVRLPVAAGSRPSSTATAPTGMPRGDGDLKDLVNKYKDSWDMYEIGISSNA